MAVGKVVIWKFGMAGRDGLYLFKHPGGILAYLHEPHDDVVQIDVAQGGVIFAFSPHLVQEQVPAVHWRQQVLIFPGRSRRTELPSGPSSPGQPEEVTHAGGGATAERCCILLSAPSVSKIRTYHSLQGSCNLLSLERKLGSKTLGPTSRP